MISRARRYRSLSADEQSAPRGAGRLQLATWQGAIARATTIAAVIDVVQRVVGARHGPSWAASAWHPRRIHSREDIEHWVRRFAAQPRPIAENLVVVAELMRSAIERMNELGPRRIARMQD
jgi:hypothetical protein